MAAAIIITPVVTGQPNNGDHHGPGNPNLLRVGSLWLGIEGWASKGFDIEESGGTTKYNLAVSVSNFSGVDWGGYKFWVGLSEQPADFPSSHRFGFDVSSGVESDGSLVLQEREEDVLRWSGTFADGTSAHFWFSFDVPDRLGVQRVWLFEQPTPSVPEPSAFALLICGLGALTLWRYLRARSYQRWSIQANQ